MREVKGRIISLESRSLSPNRGISSLEKDHTHVNEINPWFKHAHGWLSVYYH